MWSKSQRVYAASSKGREARRRYQQSEKCREAHKRYLANRKARKAEAKLSEAVVIAPVENKPETGKIKKEVRNKK
ncbi:hypothetical protein A2160_00255 [Candidatus Beckwithbacteria bacterium RBG_13_42_9]|uniref:Uncharacterized protein n=1 Tax=Candidatus Beckwithbacteria bacterium RBG_13_42_9 TaxID=1797457 RepID=A0A1F5E544_9BACT|nr:MAG: hypothetical protein A2160_00255 [Candidatus Beckwithbacteria bacterium RBG_13_42_9]